MTPGNGSKRRVVRAVLLLAAVAAALPVLNPAGAAAADQDALSVVTGTWTTTVNASGKPPSTITLVFHYNHDVDLTGPTGADGNPLYVGTGTWRRESHGQFSFDVTHPLPGADGNLIGTLRGHQQGTVTGNTFATSGQSFIDKVDGTTVGPNPVTMTAVRANCA